MRRTPRALTELLTLAVVSAVVAAAPTGTAAADPGPAAAPAGTQTVLTVVGTPTLGESLTLRAEVTSAGEPVVDGRVLFDAAATEAQLWGADSYEEPYPDATNVSLGDAALDDDGVATVELTLDTATLPFVEASGTFFVAAEYQPYDGLEIYDDRYVGSTGSTAVVVEDAVVPGPSIRPFGTSFFRAVGEAGVVARVGSTAELMFLLRFPSGTSVATTGTLGIRTTAGLLTLQRSAQSQVGDTVVALWTLGALPYPSLVGAPVQLVYTSTDPAVGSVEQTVWLHVVPEAAVAFTAKGIIVEGRHRVRLTAQVSASGVPTATGRIQFRDTDGNPTGAPVRLVNGRASIDVAPPDGGVMTIHGGKRWMVRAEYLPDEVPSAFPVTVSGVDIPQLTFPAATSPVTPLSTATATVDTTTCVDGDVTVAVTTGHASTVPASATVTVTDVPSSCGAPARPVRRASVSDTATTTIVCRPASRGFACPVGSVAAGSRIRVTVKAPLPAFAAGKRVAVVTRASVVDAVTGERSTLATTRTSVDVPRRTVLSARLVPTSPVTSVAAGRSVGYRLIVRNTGILRANRVRACIRVGSGAAIVRAAGARVRSARACWTVRTVDPGRTKARVIKVRAPRNGGLRLAAVVTPRVTQAARVRLHATLPVR